MYKLMYNEIMNDGEAHDEFNEWGRYATFEEAFDEMKFEINIDLARGVTYAYYIEIDND